VAFTIKAWRNNREGRTPVNAAALIDLEARLSAYAASLAAIASLSDVNLTGLVDGASLTWDVSAGEWSPVVVGGGGGATAADNFLYLGTDAGGPITLTGTDSLATMLDG
jgi:hypothetical protein